MTPSNEWQTGECWYYATGAQPLGPFSFGALREMARAGQLQPATPVCRQGNEKWLPAGSVPGLFVDSTAAAGAESGFSRAGPTLPASRAAILSANTVLAPGFAKAQ